MILCFCSTQQLQSTIDQLKSQVYLNAMKNNEEELHEEERKVLIHIIQIQLHFTSVIALLSQMGGPKRLGLLRERGLVHKIK